MSAVYHPYEPVEYSLQSNRVLKTGDILEDIMVLDKSEIKAASLAQSMATKASVKQYANLLKQAHTQNLHQAKRLSRQIGAPIKSTESVRLENHAKEELQHLQSQTGADFDKAFIKGMIQDHKTALGIIDQDIASSNNAKLTKFLQETRKHVHMHLVKAQTIQAKEGL